MHSIKYIIDYNADKKDNMYFIYIPETLPPGKYLITLGNFNQIQNKTLEVTLILNAKTDKKSIITHNTFRKEDLCKFNNNL